MTVPVAKAAGNNNDLLEDDFNDATYRRCALRPEIRG